MLSKLATATAIAALASTVYGAATPDYMPVACRINCGRALTEFNKCKAAADFNNCLCADNSMFHRFADPCLQCGDAAWQDYGQALSIPMQQCKMTLPGPIPDHGRHSHHTDDEQKQKEKDEKEARKKAEKEQKEREKAEKKKAKDEERARKNAEKESKKQAKEEEKERKKADRDRDHHHRGHESDSE